MRRRRSEDDLNACTGAQLRGSDGWSELRVVQSLRLGPRSGPWVSGHFRQTARVRYRMIDLAISERIAVATQFSPRLQVKRKSTLLGAITRARDTSGCTSDKISSARRGPPQVPQAASHRWRDDRHGHATHPKLTVQGITISGMVRVFFG